VQWVIRKKETRKCEGVRMRMRMRMRMRLRVKNELEDAEPVQEKERR
jgi:hypothetical protein